jgi:sulfhydrogenase subunit alpha
MNRKKQNSGPDDRANSRTIRVEALARVEGEGAFQVVLRDGRVQDVRLTIFEPPRYFEAFLRGRHYREVPDIVARICGICPVAYQMSACHALEHALGVFDAIDPEIRALRNLFYCGEWIESHMLHMFLLHLPDFWGYESAISMAADHRELVQRSLRIKKTGNAILEMLGGRSVHPVGACVGGFHRAPRQDQVAVLLPQLRDSRDDMCDLVLTLAQQVEFPELERDYEFVSLVAENEYPMNLGRIKSNKGLDVDQMEFGEAIEERQVGHSNALHAVIRQRGAYLVGPLARLNLNADKLHRRAGELLPQVCDAVGKPLPWRSNSLSLLARGLEFESTTRHGKFLFVHVPSPPLLVLHFGMTGYLDYARQDREPPKHTRILFHFANEYWLAYVSQRKLGRVTLTGDAEDFVRQQEMGPDALDDQLTFAQFRQRLKGRRGKSSRR